MNNWRNLLQWTVKQWKKLHVDTKHIHVDKNNFPAINAGEPPPRLQVLQSSVRDWEERRYQRWRTVDGWRSWNIFFWNLTCKGGYDLGKLPLKRLQEVLSFKTMEVEQEKSAVGVDNFNSAYYPIQYTCFISPVDDTVENNWKSFLVEELHVR